MNHPGRRLPTAPTLALLLVLAAACQDPEEGTLALQPPEVSDSAGVTIVEHRGVPDELPLWTLAETPEVSIGVVDGAGPDAFSNVGHLALRSDGSLVVVDSPNREIRAFAPDGSHLWTAGGRGDGPGEFQSLSQPAVLRGDSILVADASRQRASVFDPDGRHVRTFSVAPPRDGLGNPSLVGATAEGAILLAATDREARWTSPSGSERSAWVVGWLGPDAELMSESPHRYLGQETLRGEAVAASGDSEFQALVRVILYQMSPQASFAADPEGAVVGIQERFEFHRLQADGSLTRIVRVAGWPVPLDRERLRAHDEAGLAAMEDPQQRAHARESLGQLRYSDHLPAFDRMVADAEGHLWVREFVPRYEAGEREGGWWVLDPEGNWIARATFPPRFTFHAARGDLAVGVRRDDLDVQWVEVHRIVEGSAER